MRASFGSIIGWLWAATAGIAAAVVVPWTRQLAHRFDALVKDSIEGKLPPTNEIHFIQSQLFAIVFGAAIAFGIAQCLSWRYRSRPTWVASIFLTIAFYGAYTYYR